MSGRVAHAVDDRRQEGGERYRRDRAPGEKISWSMAERADDVLRDLQEEYGNEKVRLGIPDRLNDKFGLKLMGTCGGIQLEGLEKPSPLVVGEEGGVLRVLQAIGLQGAIKTFRCGDYSRHTW